MRKGFTLVEISIAIAIVAILFGLGVAIMDPGRQFARGRNTERTSEMSVILNAIGQKMADNRGRFECASGELPTSTAKMASAAGYDIAPCLVPVYLSAMPFDPRAEGAHYTSGSDYDTGYDIVRDPVSGRITVSAPAAELGEAVSVTR
ncbi:MAG: hypothetical protein UY99_C0013G0017 [Parcubacteria group bacterium GW2011_GWA1_59_11]|nr:MAG: hypothetical protein UY99_C0013G0017 [Parcubacteria group bacterium GW2011_GWA1_59_11]